MHIQFTYVNCALLTLSNVAFPSRSTHSIMFEYAKYIYVESRNFHKYINVVMRIFLACRSVVTLQSDCVSLLCSKMPVDRCQIHRYILRGMSQVDLCSSAKSASFQIVRNVFNLSCVFLWSCEFSSVTTKPKLSFTFKLSLYQILKNLARPQ